MYPERVIKIDSNGTIDQMEEDIMKVLQERLWNER